MKSLPRRLTLVLLAGAAAIAFPSWATAQEYPAKPIRIVVGYSPGGVNDLVARVIAERWSKSLGQAVIVENKPGAGGAIGASFVAKANPDGYTLLLASVTNIAMLPSTVKDLPYDPEKDFAPVGLVAGSPSVLVVRPSLPVQSLKELISFVKKKPEGLTFGSGGTGTSSHLNVELLAQVAGIKLNEIPYKGDAPGVAALLGGQIPLMMPTLASALPYIKSGMLRALAISTPTRSSLLPDIPTVSESGLPGYEFNVWVGLLAPRGTPDRIVKRLNGELAAMNADPSVKERLNRMGAEPLTNSPEQFAAYISSEVAKWKRVTKGAGMKTQ